MQIDPLDKPPGLRLIGVGELYRRIAEKAVMILLKKDVVQVAGLLYLRGGQVAGSELTIHAMHDIFNDNNMEGILLIDAENAFNSINLKVMLPNLKFIFPVIATYISNCCTCPCLSLVEQNYYIKRVQRKVIHYRWVLILSGYYHCFNFCSISFLSMNSTSKRLLLQMILWLLTNHQALKTTGAN